MSHADYRVGRVRREKEEREERVNEWESLSSLYLALLYTCLLPSSSSLSLYPLNGAYGECLGGEKRKE